MYHLELRKFPHSVCCFNQSEAQMLAVAVPWVGGEWIEQGERKWNANEASLTVLEGPKLSMPELAMGRGWRNAQRRGQDVTERVLIAARSLVGERPVQAAQPLQPERSTAEDAGEARGGDAGGSGAGHDLLADSLALELLALLDDGPMPPARIWDLARTRLDRASAADSLALAERSVRSLLRRGLIVLTRQQADAAQGPVLAEDEAEAALSASETWGGGGHERGALLIARRA